MMAVAVPASCDAQASAQGVPQDFGGSLTYSFCDAEPCPIGGILTGHGPIEGEATVRILSDVPNADFTETETRWQLDFESGTLILDLTIRTEPGDDFTDPCRISFAEAGTWVVSSGSGRFAGFDGDGVLRSSGNAIGHDETCGTTPTSLVTYAFAGLVVDHDQ